CFGRRHDTQVMPGATSGRGIRRPHGRLDLTAKIYEDRVPGGVTTLAQAPRLSDQVACEARSTEESDMMRVSRRDFFGLPAAGPGVAGATPVTAAPPKVAGLSSMTRDVEPISKQEHAARLAKLQGLMQRQKTAAFLVESGSSLEYFTGIRWW